MSTVRLLYRIINKRATSEALMSKRKTSIQIFDQLWRDWTKFVIDETGSSRRTSSYVEKAIREYMERHSKNNKTNSSVNESKN